MYTRVAVTIPQNLLNRLEKERKEVHLNRSEFFKKAIESFLGIDTLVNEKQIRKYEPIYKALAEEDKKLSKEMMRIAKKTIPND
ncbi:MAG: ribbon-helix-helix protein, CopG family [Elusimicrobia bacterium]|nr:ribbon-helix-helix protein, CopG family [Elusimicrobiota bacterium]